MASFKFKVLKSKTITKMNKKNLIKNIQSNKTSIVKNKNGYYIIQIVNISRYETILSKMLS